MLQYKVTNNEPRYHSIAYGGDIKKIRKIYLSPGANVLSEKQYEAIKNHPYFKKRLETKLKGQIGVTIFTVKAIQVDAAVDVAELEETVGEPSAAPLQQSVLTDLTAMTIKDAEEVLSETYDVTALEHWAEVETRSTLKLKISKRLEKLLQDADAGKEKAE